jgi:hypothetical protein
MDFLGVLRNFGSLTNSAVNFIINMIKNKNPHVLTVLMC